MKRWLIWFSLGAALFVLFAASAVASVRAGSDRPVFAVLPFVGWLVVTGVAVPVAIVRWLVTGRARGAADRA